MIRICCANVTSDMFFDPVLRMDQINRRLKLNGSLRGFRITYVQNLLQSLSHSYSTSVESTVCPIFFLNLG